MLIQKRTKQRMVDTGTPNPERSPSSDVHSLPLSSLTDVTDRNEWLELEMARLQEALDQAHARLARGEGRMPVFADNMTQLVWMANPQGDIVWNNQRCVEYTGMALEQARGWGWQQALHPDQQARVVQNFRAKCTQGEAWEDIYLLRGRDHRYRWFLNRVTPLHDEQGRLLNWLGTGTDITEQVELEKNLRDANERLAEANLRKSEFLALLSHELRNPLAPIRNSVGILRRVKPGSDAAQRAIDVIERQVGHLSRLVDDLLETTRIVSGKIRVQKAPVELGELLRRIVEDHRSLFRTNSIQLELEVPSDAAWVDADATRLSQVVSNLLSNALKFTPARGTVTIALDVEAGKSLAIRVRDTGIGIDRDLLATIFEPFMQADRSLERTRGGLGLGLALVRGVVELHGGQVEARSEGIGKGTEIIVRLPRMLSVVPAEAAPAKESPGASPSHTILIIEDNPDAAETLRMVLELSGHQVQTAGDGAEGLAQARTFQPDLVLCDIGLPHMDGYQVARAFRSEPALARIRLVALTGYTQPEDLDRALEAGFDQHLAKPANLNALEQLIASLPPRAP